VFGVINLTIPLLTPNIPCLRYLLRYRTHHSVCDTLLLPTPRVGITISLYTEYRPPDVLSWGGLLMSSRLEGWLLTNFSLSLVTCQLFATGSVTNLTFDSSYSLTMCDSSYSLTICDSTPGCQDPHLNRYMRTEYSTPCFTVYLPSQ
jgi:hypothetical protein